MSKRKKEHGRFAMTTVKHLAGDHMSLMANNDRTAFRFLKPPL